MLTGRTLGDFTVGPMLGEGGYGVVYRAEQRTLGREAVLKILHARHGTNEAVVQRFLREAQLASRLDHPYAAHIYAFGAEPDGLLWIAMELVRGTTLGKVRQAQPGGTFTVARLVPLLDGLCEVVHTAHEQGIVHRDLKPDNVMVLSRAGRLLPKLLDLGIAKLVSASAGHGETGEAVDLDIDLALDTTLVAASSGGAMPTLQGVIGSPHYMAPEQWIEGADVDARTDVYALGVVAFEMLAGKPPFAGASIVEIARGHVRGELPALPDHAAALTPVVHRALAKRPGERFPSALAFADALRSAAAMRVRAEALPRLDDELRAEIAGLPQPIADAIAALEAARNPHQARDALWETVRIVARWLAIVALAAHSRSGGTPTAPVLALLREIHRRELTDAEWIDLARGLVAPFASIKDAHPIPELVELLAREPSPFDALLALRATEGAITSEESLRDRLARTLPVLAPLLRAITFLTAYHLIVPRGDRAEVWMGVRRSARPIIAVAPGLEPDEPLLADSDARPVLQLAPLVQIAAPAPGANDELFVFAGPGRVRSHGARLGADPHGFERHDDAVWTWLRAQLPDRIDDASRAVEQAPYRGLAAFVEADADMFFGREHAAQAFVNQLVVQPLVAVVGPSGTGKSSFVRAGVVPILPAGWHAVVLRPSAAPLAAIAARPELAGSPPVGETRVVIVDQLEELFTLCRDDGERAKFAEAIAAFARDDRQRVVLTIRDDFVAMASELPALRDSLVRAITLLATPARDDLARVLVEPARRAGYDFDDGLVDRMVAAVAGQVGALALLSFTALRLWELRDRHFKRLTASAYAAIGGVEGALAQHAEDTLRGCTADEQRQIREAFRHLVTAEGTRAVTTRRELDQVLGRGARVIDRLVAARLVVASDDGNVELVHEALLAAWPRLVTWRLEDAEGARLRDQLRAAARQWHDRGRPRGLLWRDDALDEYARWRARWPGSLPEIDAAFGDASLRDARRGRRIRRGLAATAAALLVAGMVAMSVLGRIAERNAADAHDREIASYVEQGRTLLVGGDYRDALAPLDRAYELGGRSLALRLMLRRARQLGDVPSLPLADTGVSAAFRPSGELVWVDLSGNAGVWDPVTGVARATIAKAPPHPRSDNFAPDVSPDGARVAIPSGEAIFVWDGATTIEIPVARAERVTFHPSGRRLAVSTATEVSVWELAPVRRAWATPSVGHLGRLAWSGDAVLEVNFAMTKARRTTETGATDLGPCQRLTTSTTGSFACLGDDVAVVHDVHGVMRTRLAAAGVDRIELSGDGKLVALARTSGVVELVEVATGAQRGLLPVRALQLAFTKGGDRLVVANASTVAIWDVASLHELMRHSAIAGSATIFAGAPYVVLDPRDRRVALVGASEIRVVSVGDPAIHVAIDAGEALGRGQWRGDDVFTTSETGVELWDGTTGARRARIDVHVADNAHISPDGTLAAIPIADSTTAEIRDVATGTVRATLLSTAAVRTAAFDPTGTRVVTGNQRGEVEIFDVRGARIATLRGHTNVVLHAEFSRDGTRVVTSSYDATARVWDATTGRELGRVHTDDDVYDAQLDATASRLVTASHDRSVVLWDAHSFARLQAFALPAAVNTTAISDDAALVAAGDDDGNVTVFDVASGREILRFAHAAEVQTVAFGAQGLLSTSFDRHAIVWDVAGTTDADVTPSETPHLTRKGIP